MGSLKTLALAGAVFAGATAVASAADLRYPQPVGLPPAPHAAPIAEASGWYLRGDIGIGALNSGKYNYSDNPSGVVLKDKDFGAQFFGGIGAGYQFNSWLRFDVTGEYRGNAKFGVRDHYSFDCSTALQPNCVNVGQNDIRGKISSMVLLANAYLDLGTWHGLTPFIGAGVGMTQNRTSGGTDKGMNFSYSSLTGVPYTGYGTSSTTVANGTKSGLAYALMAGVSADVSPNLKLEAAYRYLNLGKYQTGTFACGGCDYTLQGRSLDSHEFKLGLRWMLGGVSYSPAPTAYPVEPPRVVKKF
jgi:opacity protein-like surface antigen